MRSDSKLIVRITCRNEQETELVGEKIGRSCRGGEIILLDGPMGAGKTFLAAAMGQGMRITQPVISPTYTILRSYLSDITGLTLHHLDLYRLSGSEELDMIGWTECLGDGSVVIVEWPGRCPDSFDPHSLLIQIEDTGNDTRVLSFHPGTINPGRFEEILNPTSPK